MNFKIYFKNSKFQGVFLIIILIIMGIAIGRILFTNKYLGINSIEIGFFIIFFAVLLFILLFPWLLSRKQIDEEKFKEKLQSKGYDITDEFCDYDYITKAYTAKNNDLKIQFYILNDKITAEQFYKDSTIELINIKIDKKNEYNGSNYSKLEVLTYSDYKVISKIDNTIICLESSRKNIKLAKKTLKDLGY